MDTSGSSQVVARPAKRSWRRHSEEFKARVIEMARQPNTSVAAVALANGLNANMLRRWVREADVPSTPDHEPQVSASPTFVQLPMPAAEPTLPPAPPAPTDAPSSIVVEIQRSGATVRANLPLCPASAAWLREVLG
jgi:transposase-like protein